MAPSRWFDEQEASEIINRPGPAAFGDDQASVAPHLTASDGTPLTGRLALRHALAKAVVAAASNRREVTLSWLEVAQDLAEEILWEEPLRESMQRATRRLDAGA